MSRRRDSSHANSAKDIGCVLHKVARAAHAKSMTAQNLPVSEETAKASIAKVNRIPVNYKTHECAVDDAGNRYAVNEQLLADLLDLGLSHTLKDGQLFVEDNDLWTISLDLKLRNPHTRQLKFFTQFLNATKKDGSSTYSFSAPPTCPRPGHAGPCSFEFESSMSRQVRLGGVTPTIQFAGQPIADAYDFGESIAPLVSEAERLQFYKVPDELASDMKFLAETSLASCRSAALWLLRVAAQHGIDARLARGLFVSVPYSTSHLWLEIRTAGEWRHADPFFLHSLAHWDVVDLSEWPLARTPQHVLLHLASGPADQYIPMVWHQGEPLNHWPRAMRTVRQ